MRPTGRRRNAPPLAFGGMLFGLGRRLRRPSACPQDHSGGHGVRRQDSAKTQQDAVGIVAGIANPNQAASRRRSRTETAPAATAGGRAKPAPRRCACGRYRPPRHCFHCTPQGGRPAPRRHSRWASGGVASIVQIASTPAEHRVLKIADHREQQRRKPQRQPVDDGEGLPGKGGKSVVRILAAPL